MLVGGLVVLLVSLNLVYYTPLRLETMYGLYGMKRSNIEPFLSPQAQAFTPALIYRSFGPLDAVWELDAAGRSLADDPLYLCLGYLSGNGCGCGGRITLTGRRSITTRKTPIIFTRTPSRSRSVDYIDRANAVKASTTIARINSDAQQERILPAQALSFWRILSFGLQERHPAQAGQDAPGEICAGPNHDCNQPMLEQNSYCPRIANCQEASIVWVGAHLQHARASQQGQAEPTDWIETALQLFEQIRLGFGIQSSAAAAGSTSSASVASPPTQTTVASMCSQ